MSVQRLFLPEAAAALRGAIAEAGGNEVLAIGRLDPEGRVAGIEVAARGNAEAVPALEPHLARGEVVVHNHPAGRLEPSVPDLAVASRLGNQGVGFYIVDNAVQCVYVVAEPIQARRLQPLDAGRLAGLLRHGGGLARIYPGFEERSSQVRMLGFVAEGFNREELRVAEAGTGVGKSLAYLIPALQWALDNGERVVVSTATINLQQQLVDKDIPLAVRLLGRDPGSYLVKGRGNYLCRTRLEEALEEASLFEEEQAGLAALRDWARATATGSRTDMTPYPGDELWSRVCSEADACHGLACPNREGCFVLKARREASAARVLVANHHLLFADLSMRLAGTGFEAAAVLPPFQHIVFDEAHNIEKNASSYFSAVFSRSQVAKYAGRLYREKKRKRHGLLLGLERVLGPEGRTAGLRRAVAEIVTRAQELEEAARSVLGGRQSLRFTEGEAPLLPALAELARAITVLSALFDELTDGLDAPEAGVESYHVYECRIQLRRLAAVGEIAQRFQRFRESRGEVFWAEGRRDRLGEISVRFIITPLSIAPMMSEAVYRPYRSVLFTSATLTVGGSFDYWKGRVGLNQVRFRETAEQQFPSPFDYASSVLLGITADAPEPEQEGFAAFAPRFIGEALAISEGHALVLFTSYAMLQQVHRVVAPELAARGIAVLRQGEEDRGRLLERFRGDAASVLLATDSFWEGVDAPGEALELLILTRLPFRVPNDPVLQARMQTIQERGGNPFFELSLPDAIVRLRQGFGRLMRRQDDRGAVLILDSRLVRRAYGAHFLESLPRCRTAFGSSGEVLAALRGFFSEIRKKRAHRPDALPGVPQPAV
jgi:ATP-dependent DNA helicase DinG